jgi:hypothetical protein
LFDNLSGRLDAAALAAALTGPIWCDRVLGTSRRVAIPVTCLWLATGNNPDLSDELCRRTVPIRLDPAVEQPHLRQGFRHQNLGGWVRDNHLKLVWAVLVLGRAWVAAGKPPGPRTLGGFESWSRVLGGILEVAGIPGLLSNRQEFDLRANAERHQWVSFVRRWFKRFGDRPVTVSDLLLLARENEALEDVLGARSMHAQKIALGKELDRKADRVIDNFRIKRHLNDFKSMKLFGLCQRSPDPRQEPVLGANSPPDEPQLNSQTSLRPGGNPVP